MCFGNLRIQCRECNGSGNGPCAPGQSNVTLAKVGLFLLLSTIAIILIIFAMGWGDRFFEALGIIYEHTSRWISNSINETISSSSP